MKKFERLKIFQLTFFILYALISCLLLFRDDIKSEIFSSRYATILFLSIWILLLCSLIFLYLDYITVTNIKSGSKILYNFAFSDQLTNIPNRLSCDTIIEKYQDEVLPEHFTCAIFEITNLISINDSFDHEKGDQILKDFSTILMSATGSDGFVGRNGGNSFLVFFEHCDSKRIEHFFRTVSSSVHKYNERPEGVPIHYRYGSAINRQAQPCNVNQLITLASARVKDY